MHNTTGSFIGPHVSPKNTTIAKHESRGKFASYQFAHDKLCKEYALKPYHVMIYCKCSFRRYTLVCPPMGPPGIVLPFSYKMITNTFSARMKQERKSITGSDHREPSQRGYVMLFYVTTLHDRAAYNVTAEIKFGN